MADYQSNSHKSKEGQTEKVPEKKIEKVIAGTARVKKKSNLRKFADVFIAEDLVSIKNYILRDVLVPSIQKAITDIITNGIYMLFNGEAPGQKKNYSSSKVSYRSYYDQRPDPRDYTQSRPRSVFDCDEVIIKTRGDAQEVLDRMDEIISSYQVLSVADFYDLMGITPSQTDYNYGWTDIHTATIVRAADGYIIKMPRAISIK